VPQWSWRSRTSFFNHHPPVHHTHIEMTVTVINSLAEFQTITNSGKPIVIDFWATWCGQCTIISPIFEKLSDTTDAIGFYKVDIDEQQAIFQEIGTHFVPTFAVFKGGKKLEEVVAPHQQRLETLITTAVSQA